MIQVCKKCSAKNLVKEDSWGDGMGSTENELVLCAKCGYKMGTIRTSGVVNTFLVEEEK
ncbi:MAG: hypothetical protein N4A44_04525 [Alphaproteobacteria bacterium]|jgi:DNA-directed RNA polymerase subunit RPC12/RpoP|nr:hypothetical protein [Alphaproteobacteria bacterium]